MIDTHCHIVPKVDDGSQDIQTSIEMGKIASELGYTGILATSHYIIYSNEINQEEYIKNIENLNQELKNNNIDLKIYSGNEIFFTNDILELIQDKKVCTLANSKYVLIELPLFNKIIPINVYDEFNRLQDAGYVPILAHPERYDFVTKDINMLVKLIESGVLIQCNIGSINGKYGKDAKRNVKKMLKRDMVHLFGTDSHNISVYCMYNKCINKIKKIIKDDEKIEKILSINPYYIINNKDIEIWYPKNK